MAADKVSNQIFEFLVFGGDCDKELDATNRFCVDLCPDYIRGAMNGQTQTPYAAAVITIRNG